MESQILSWHFCFQCCCLILGTHVYVTFLALSYVPHSMLWCTGAAWLEVTPSWSNSVQIVSCGLVCTGALEKPVLTCSTVEHDSIYSFRRLLYQGKPKCCVLSCLPFQSLQNSNTKMDLENFSRSDIKRHLAELGYSNITEEKLDSFVRYNVFFDFSPVQRFPVVLTIHGTW